MRRIEKTFIYFVRSGDYIKIGQSQHWPDRIKTMQTGSPHTLIVLLVLVDKPEMESRLHSRFRHSHFRGEWFHSSTAILNYIKEHLSRCVAKSDENDLRTYDSTWGNAALDRELEAFNAKYDPNWKAATK